MRRVFFMDFLQDFGREAYLSQKVLANSYPSAPYFNRGTIYI